MVNEIQHLEDYEHQFLEVLAKVLIRSTEKKLKTQQNKEQEDSNETTDS